MFLATLATTACGDAPSDFPATGSVAPDVLVITLDTVRAERLGAYGGDPDVSPTFDSLARQGTLYLDATTPSPLTLPAHASLLTGHDPPGHGLRVNGRGRLPTTMPTVAGRFLEGGYATAAFVSSVVLHPRHGLDRDFEVYDAPSPPERDAAATVDGALRWLSATAGHSPRFLWVHLYDAHAPYRPPDPYRRLYRDRPYDGELAFVDAEVARLVDGFRRGPAPAAASSSRGRGFVLALVGDHGEGLGDHGESEHGLLLYQSTLRVPLLIVSSTGTAATVADPVSTARLPATLCRLAGMMPPPGTQPPLPRGDAPDAGEVLPVYSEALLGRADYGWSPLFAWRRGRWKVTRGAYASLHDLETDPSEQTDRLAGRATGGTAPSAARTGGSPTPTDAGRAQALLTALDDYLSRVPTVTADPSVVTDVDRLRALGYLGGSDAPQTSGDTTFDPRTQVSFHEDVAGALASYRDGELDNAAAMLDDLLGRQPDNPFLLDLAGSVRLAAGEPAMAVSLFRQALDRGGDRSALRLRLAEALLAAGRPETAEAEARRALTGNSDTTGRGALALCRALVSQGRPDEARVVAVAALDRLPPAAAYRAPLEAVAGGNVTGRPEGSGTTEPGAVDPPRRW